MTPDSKPPIGRLLRTVLIALGAVGALGAGAEAVSAQPTSAHHWQHRTHHGVPHRAQYRQHVRHWRHGYPRHRRRHPTYRWHHPHWHHWYVRHHEHHGHEHHGRVHPAHPARRSMPGRFAASTERAVHFALAHLGDGYSYGASGPHWWDCSGLVQQAYRRAGIRLPRVAAAQYRAAIPIRRSQLRRGDLVFWSSNGHPSGIHHVAVYLGRGRYVEAPRPGRRVRVSSFAAYRPTMYARV